MTAQVLPQTTRTPGPWINSGNRIYMGAAVERREIAVATRADPTIRHAADANAAFIVTACNAHDALLADRERLCAALAAISDANSSVTGGEASRRIEELKSIARAALAQSA